MATLGGTQVKAGQRGAEGEGSGGKGQGRAWGCEGQGDEVGAQWPACLLLQADNEGGEDSQGQQELHDTSQE